MLEGNAGVRIRGIMARMKCPKSFKCVESGFQDLCKAEDFGDENSLLCREGPYPQCAFALSTDSSGQGIAFCRCPLRVHLSRELHK